MQELQRTLAELEREEREMAAQRLSARTTGQKHTAAASQQNQQVHKWLRTLLLLNACVIIGR